MTNINNRPKSIKKRNPFVALCEYASNGNWCWKVYCTTCGHTAFKVSFSKLIRGQHPDDETFWPYGKENHSPLKEAKDYGDFIRNASTDNQILLTKIVAEAKLSDIQKVAKFPDWLGYLGLVINHCPNAESQKILSDSLLPQFIVLAANNLALREYLMGKMDKHEFINLADLEKIEQIGSELLDYK